MFKTDPAKASPTVRWRWHEFPDWEASSDFCHDFGFTLESKTDSYGYDRLGYDPTGIDAAGYSADDYASDPKLFARVAAWDESIHGEPPRKANFRQMLETTEFVLHALRRHFPGARERDLDTTWQPPSREKGPLLLRDMDHAGNMFVQVRLNEERDSVTLTYDRDCLDDRGIRFEILISDLASEQTIVRHVAGSDIEVVVADALDEFDPELRDFALMEIQTDNGPAIHAEYVARADAFEAPARSEVRSIGEFRAFVIASNELAAITGWQATKRRSKTVEAMIARGLARIDNRDRI